MPDHSIDTAPEVLYREIAGCPGYRIGSDGSVWSCRVYGSNASDSLRLESTWRQLKTHRRDYGARYVVVCLRPIPGGKVVCRYIHDLVLEAFVGPRPEGMEACHYDRNTANNAVGNLRWDTHAANVADQIRHGTTHRGEKSPMAILTDAQARDVFRLHQEGYLDKDIAHVLGVTRGCVNDIRRGARWKHIYAEVNLGRLAKVVDAALIDECLRRGLHFE